VNETLLSEDRVWSMDEGRQLKFERAKNRKKKLQIHKRQQARNNKGRAATRHTDQGDKCASKQPQYRDAESEEACAGTSSSDKNINCFIDVYTELPEYDSWQAEPLSTWDEIIKKTSVGEGSHFRLKEEILWEQLSEKLCDDGGLFQLNVEQLARQMSTLALCQRIPYPSVIINEGRTEAERENMNMDSDSDESDMDSDEEQTEIDNEDKRKAVQKECDGRWRSGKRFAQLLKEELGHTTMWNEDKVAISEEKHNLLEGIVGHGFADNLVGGLLKESTKVGLSDAKQVDKNLEQWLDDILDQ